MTVHATMMVTLTSLQCVLSGVGRKCRPSLLPYSTTLAPAVAGRLLYRLSLTRLAKARKLCGPQK